MKWGMTEKTGDAGVIIRSGRVLIPGDSIEIFSR